MKKELREERAKALELEREIVPTLTYVTVKAGELKLRLFKSMSPGRLSDQGETQAEYRLRRRFIEETLKKHAKGRSANNRKV